MNSVCLVLVLLTWAAFTDALPDDPQGEDNQVPVRFDDYPRDVTAVLAVTNGAIWGTWHREEFCASGSYAVGFELKLQRDVGIIADNTALNGIEIMCDAVHKPANAYFGTASSQKGPWGSWTGPEGCPNTPEGQQVLTRFSLKVEADQGLSDDTAANGLLMWCQQLGGESSAGHSIEGSGGPWGTYGTWSAYCPANSAVCGIQTKVEEARSSGDETALNDARFFCCSD